MLLAADRIRALLAEFVERLGNSGDSYDGVVVGGAALTLAAIPQRTATEDIDTFGQLPPKATQIIEGMAQQEDLPHNWLNSKAQMFMSPIADTSQLPILFESGNARIRLMDAHTLLALKLRAGRIAKDADDIRALLQVLDIQSLEAAQQVVDDYWDGEQEMAADAEAIVRDQLES